MVSTHVIAVRSDTFDKLATSPRIVVIDCSAQWCPPCRVFEPVFAAAAADHPELTFAALDTDESPELAAKLDVRAQPTIVFLRAGAIVYKHVGAMSATKFEALIERVTRA